MADIVKGLKSVWLRGMEAIGDTASNIANKTKYKVQEMNLINRRHEILSDFGTHAYALWQSGMEFPEELHKQLEELSRVDESLATIRAERLAYLQTVEEEKAARAAAGEAQTEEAAEEVAVVEAAEEQTELEDQDAEEILCEEEADPETHEAPVIDFPEEQGDEVSEEPFSDPIADLMDEQMPEEPAQKDRAAQVKEKVNRALDTVQDKMSRLGKVIDRSVQNLAKVVLQNDDKEKGQDETNPEDEQP